ncbi:pentatricopeptide repeat-containing protein, mitochondrial [Cocos nucifera]|uniref:Pentatricopeptide repeat-containing protein, mitochondrial n=1 Tax=Cocos nucifera TaxID=13894 RepID=A0A8K0HX52_COCNU|nr:pentatricopeptide repeat-containing protein, mitochondrial [Cocos nucifera]
MPSLLPSSIPTRSSILFLRVFSLSFSSSCDPSPPLNDETVLETLSSYANDWPRALDFFHWAATAGGFSHTPATLARAVDILGKHFEFSQAWSLLSSHHPSPTSSSPDSLRPAFRALFNRLAAARLVSDALAALRRSADDFGLRDRATFHLLVDALCDHRLVPEAEDLCLRSSSPFPPDTKTYNLLLRGWLKMGWWGKCREFWDEMDRKSIAKDLHSYSIYMDILSKSGKPWKAVKLYKEMKKKGIVLDVVAYNTVIQAMGLSNGVDFSIRLYREMLDLGCQPNVATFNTIIKLLCREGRFREAYAFVDQMRKKGCDPNVITYHCFFQNLNRPQEILELFDKMVKSGCRPRMETYVMLMKKFGRWGFLRPVFIVWKAMEEHGCSPDAFAYNALIDALLQKGMVEMARKYDEEMLAKGLAPKPRKELGTKGPSMESDDDNALSGVF